MSEEEWEDEDNRSRMRKEDEEEDEYIKVEYCRREEKGMWRM